MPGFSIQNFRADLDNRGVQRTNRATLLFSPPPKLAGADTQGLCIRCESMSLPAVWFTVDDHHKRYGVGPTDKVPIQPMFDPLPTSFIADMRGATHQFFYDWTMLIGNYNSPMGYEGEYQSNYVTDLFVLTFNEQLEQLMQYRFINAFPQAIQEQPMNWQEQDQLVKLHVTFNYREWVQTTVDSPLTDSIDSIITSAERVIGGNNFIPSGVLDSILNVF